MKEKMIEFIKTRFPKAVLEDYYESKWGKEQQFRPCEESEETYTCICKNGNIEVLKEF